MREDSNAQDIRQAKQHRALAYGEKRNQPPSRTTYARQRPVTPTLSNLPHLELI